jgi:uncharacterized protein YecE (DUF72 family)
MFANPTWRGKLFTDDAKPREFLTQYAQALNTVEGNSTFYGVPSDATIDSWREAVPDTFRFCFKFPRQVTHDLQLVGDAFAKSRQFLDQLRPLRSRIGLLLVQLPPTFAGAQFPALAEFLAALPRDWEYAVEPRHPDYFGGRWEQPLLELLTGLGINRALFDTGDLHSLSAHDATVQEAQRKKPRMPRRADATGASPFVRYVGHNDPMKNIASFRWLASCVAEWIAEGRTPFVFLHAPDDCLVPDHCQVFHSLLEQIAGTTTVGPLPLWPAQRKREGPRQRELFQATGS